MRIKAETVRTVSFGPHGVKTNPCRSDVGARLAYADDLMTSCRRPSSHAPSRPLARRGGPSASLANTTAAGLALWTSVSLAIGAQTAPPQAEPPIFRTRVDLVELDVRVTDARGAAVTDLTAADVEVREDGVAQRIAELVRVSRPMAPTAAGPARPDAADVANNYGASQARVYVLVLDDLHVDGRRTLEVRRIGRAFVDRVVAPGDLAAVVYASGRTDAGQAFTSSRTRLYEAIDRFTGRKLRSATLERAEVYNQFFRGNRNAPRPQDLRDTSDQERAFNARAALQTLTAATTMLGRIEGRRKAVLVVSEGLDYDLSGVTNGPASPTGAMSMTPGPVMTGLDGSAIARAFGQTIAMASRANVTFYAVDPRAGDVSDDIEALRAPPENPSLRVTAQAIIAEKQDAHQTLQGLASQTGGFAMLGPGDLARLERIAQESSEYYLLRYYPEQPLVRGEFRAVQVAVKRDGARVVARRGYYAKPGPSGQATTFAAAGISPALGAALAAPLPSDGLPLRLHAAPLRGDRRLAQVLVTTQLPGVLLATAGEPLATTLEVGMLAIEATTGAQSGAGSVVEVQLDAVGVGLVRTGDYRVVTRLALAAGRYQLRVGLRDRRTDRLGVATLDVVVPDFSERKPTLSGLVLTSTLADSAPTAIDAETARLAPALPSAVRRFTTVDELAVAVHVYDADRGRGPITLRTQIEDEQGARLMEASAPASASRPTTAASTAPGAPGDGASRHVWPVRLGALPPGRYVVAAELWREGARAPLVRRETRIVLSGGGPATR
jgi:VWFA-related protein